MHWVVSVVGLLLFSLLNPDRGDAQESKALRMIIVRDKQEAQQIHQQLRQGASFSVIAASKSIGPERNAWGYSGVVRLQDVQPELRPVLQALQPGQISAVLELNRRFVIVKVISPQIERHYETADRALRAGQTAAAVQALQAAVALEEDNVQTYLKLGFAYERAKQYEDAITVLEKAQRYAPREPQVALLRGAAYTHAAVEHKNRAHAEQAIQAYQQALQFNKNFAQAVHFGLGKVYLLALQQPATAVEHLEKAAKTSPRIEEVHRLLIQAYYDIQRYQQAMQHLQVAKGLGYDFPELREALNKVKR
jgi:tetratricopeptide (TPR) repeat protein